MPVSQHCSKIIQVLSSDFHFFECWMRGSDFTKYFSGVCWNRDKSLDELRQISQGRFKHFWRFKHWPKNLGGNIETHILFWVIPCCASVLFIFFFFGVVVSGCVGCYRISSFKSYLYVELFHLFSYLTRKTQNKCIFCPSLIDFTSAKSFCPDVEESRQGSRWLRPGLRTPTVATFWRQWVENIYNL